MRIDIGEFRFPDQDAPVTVTVRRPRYDSTVLRFVVHPGGDVLWNTQPLSEIVVTPASGIVIEITQNSQVEIPMRAEFTSMMENGKREIFVKIFDKVGKDEQVVLVLSTGYLDRDQATEERAAQFVIETMERRLHEVTRLFKEQGLL